MHFSYKILAPKITKLCFGFLTIEKLLNSHSYKKCLPKMLMKLTPENTFTYLQCAFYLTQSSNKQIICFDFKKQNRAKHLKSFSVPFIKLHFFIFDNYNIWLMDGWSETKIRFKKNLICLTTESTNQCCQFKTKLRTKRSF